MSQVSATSCARGCSRQHGRLALLAALSLALAACAPLGPEPDAAPQPGTAEVAEAALSPALLALVDRAQVFADAGDLDEAAAALERALRLAPEEPELWHRLAALRLAEGDWGAAEAMALRSIDRDSEGTWRRANWRVIAEARRQAGDREGAREAEARLRAG